MQALRLEPRALKRNPEVAHAMPACAVHSNGWSAHRMEAVMANLFKRPLHDPFEEMRSLLQWDPFRQPMPLRTEALPAQFTPAFEVKETKDGYLFKADLPGVKEADLDVSLDGDRLLISGKRESERHEDSDTFYAYERSYGAFQRSFTLPRGADVEHAHAELKEGVLTVLVPRSVDTQPRKIAVGSTPVAKKA